jgi:hypothetical protein
VYLPTGIYVKIGEPNIEGIISVVDT